VAALAEPDPDMDDTVLSCATGIAYGDVTYGNVGSKERLDFTVIGSAANVAARLGDHGKANGRSIVVSEEVAKVADCPAVSLGSLNLRNVAEPVEAFAVETVSTIQK
jgi:class 3 adenylate cyclase